MQGYVLHHGSYVCDATGVKVNVDSILMITSGHCS